MSFAQIKTRSAIGIQAKPVSVEVHLSAGLPSFAIVGLAETAVKESKERVRSALLNSYFEFPYRRITVNLAPADLPKSGSGLDLAIAIGILAASEQLPSTSLSSHEFIGELALNGQLRGVTGIIPMILAAQTDHQILIIAKDNTEEASMTGYTQVYTAQTLLDVCRYLSGNASLEAVPVDDMPVSNEAGPDWSEVKGQQHAKFALEIAASGGHSVLLCGSPGSGKTMLARRFNTLLPDLSDRQALESAAICSLRGQKLDYRTLKRPAFRAPHHSASMVALVGGGSPPKPGEISLAHHGVLFLDELPEFHRYALETLREPLESGQICISRAAHQVEFPATFQLLAAMNPCPCGHWGNPKAVCFCSPDRIQRYLNKLSAPLLDRIDMQIHVQALSQEELMAEHPMQSGLSQEIQKKVIQIRALQWERQGCLNVALSPRRCEEVCDLSASTRLFLTRALSKLVLSGRAYDRLLKVARTIADYEGSIVVDEKALQQALLFRQTLKFPG